MLYCLLGKTCSGKTTAFKNLVELGFTPVVTYTTRPKRSAEINGKDYNFLTDKQFEQLNDSIIAKKTFTVVHGELWSYGINIKDVVGEEEKVVIVEPYGYRDLINKLGKEKIIGIYLDAPFETRYFRGLNRQDNIKELVRRLNADEEDFIGLENEVDYIIPSIEKQEALEKIIKILRG